ncbi:TIGR01244 family sulfur transferase [Tropicimonas marinistellae]|uniref:TIGR01244 family sulfur transferase n=1 Tax=Tropicimonas marinistellae TaxID=1739787 RepID=UPI00082DD0BF|nr:TIGR01244 family sulfur transferase [Tropicimonas marinistellae]
MDIRPLSETYAVSPQITPEDVPAIVAAGFRTIICNRPDDEIPPFLRAEMVRAAAEQVDLTFVDNPIDSRDVGREAVRLQRDAIANSDGPVLAYCASGTRSTVVWMFGAARSTAPDTLINAAMRAGYPLNHLREQLEIAARIE